MRKRKHMFGGVFAVPPAACLVHLGVRLGALELRQLRQDLVRDTIHAHVAILIGTRLSF